MALIKENSSVPPALREYGRYAAGKLYAGTKDNGGATVCLTSLDTANRSNGFYVGGAANYTGKRIESLRYPVEGFTRRNAEYAIAYVYASMLPRDSNGHMYGTPDNGFIGTWVHDGIVYIDAVTHFESLNDAIDAGRARGELAVWDIAGNCEVFVSELVAV